LAASSQIQVLYKNFMSTMGAPAAVHDPEGGTRSVQSTPFSSTQDISTSTRQLAVGDVDGAAVGGTKEPGGRLGKAVGSRVPSGVGAGVGSGGPGVGAGVVGSGGPGVGGPCVGAGVVGSGGPGVGAGVGSGVGSGVGAGVGSGVGSGVGAGVGSGVGSLVGGDKLLETTS